MNGDVGLVSSSNEGSTFFVDIPFVEPDAWVVERRSSLSIPQSSQRKKQRA
jgi:hypothetical protein